MAAPLTCDEARPGRCPRCGAAGRPAGASLTIVGHGLRERLLLGPVAYGEPALVTAIQTRRYRCRACGATLVVQPLGIAARFAYTVVAIVTALGRWSEGAPAAATRREVSPFATVGAAAATGWASLRRWTKAARRLFVGAPVFTEATLRQTARRLLAYVASFAPRTTGALFEDAVAGAVHAARGPSLM